MAPVSPNQGGGANYASSYARIQELFYTMRAFSLFLPSKRRRREKPGMGGNDRGGWSGRHVQAIDF
jgi:hypothetical protein